MVGGYLQVQQQQADRVFQEMTLQILQPQQNILNQLIQDTIGIAVKVIPIKHKSPWIHFQGASVYSPIASAMAVAILSAPSSR